MPKEKFFDKKVTINLRSEHREMIYKLMKQQPDIYENISHVIRCSITTFYNQRYKNEIIRN